MRSCDLVITRWGARYRGNFLPCATGWGGIGQKSGEGDGITPKGKFGLKAIGYRRDRLAAPTSILPSQKIGPMDIWSDDAQDPAYNHWLHTHAHRFSHEALRRADPLYDIFAVLDFNWPIATPGKGSAIFLHCWRKPRHQTEGCIAFSQQHLLHILTTWTNTARVITH